MAKAMTKDTKPKRKTKLERTTEAQLFLEQDELQKQLEAEELNTDTPECKPTEVHEQRTIMREQRTIMREQRTIMREQHTIMREQRTIMREQPIIRRLRKL